MSKRLRAASAALVVAVLASITAGPRATAGTSAAGEDAARLIIIRYGERTAIVDDATTIREIARLASKATRDRAGIGAKFEGYLWFRGADGATVRELGHIGRSLLPRDEATLAFFAAIDAAFAKHAASVAQLVALADDADEQLYYHATQQLRHAAKDDVATVVAAVARCNQEKARASLCATLATLAEKHGDADGAIAAELRRVAREDGADAKASACKALVVFGAASEDALIAALADASPEPVEAACYTLSRLGTKLEARHVAPQIARGGRWIFHAVEALRTTDDVEAVGLLLGVIEDRAAHHDHDHAAEIVGRLTAIGADVGAFSVREGWDEARQKRALAAWKAWWSARKR